MHDQGHQRIQGLREVGTDFWCKAAEEELYSLWIERVASTSNSADAPSTRVCPTRRHLVRGHLKKSGDDVGAAI